MFKAPKLALVVVALFCGACVLWWWGLNEYRETAAQVVKLRKDLTKLSADMDKMKAHVQETERVLAAVDSLRNEIKNQRSQTDEALESVMCYGGSERLDRLERLLEEDLARRKGGGVDAANDAAH